MKMAVDDSDNRRIFEDRSCIVKGFSSISQNPYFRGSAITGSLEYPLETITLAFGFITRIPLTASLPSMPPLIVKSIMTAWKE